MGAALRRMERLRRGADAQLPRRRSARGVEIARQARAAARDADAVARRVVRRDRESVRRRRGRRRGERSAAAAAAGF